jgi:hypothetical protein
MEKFMLIFHNEAYQTEVEPSPEEIQAEMQRWNDWIGGIAAQGKFVGSEALMPFGKIVRGSQHVITDGPFTEGKEVIGGYAIVSADSIEDAIELAKGCPIFDIEGAVEVRPVVNFG